MKKNGHSLPCCKCSIPIEIYKEQDMLDSGDMWRIKATCPHCGAYAKWLGFDESNLPPERIAEMKRHNYDRKYKKLQ